MKCYSAAKKLVTAGATTWEQLTALGMVESEKDAFTAEFERRAKGCLPEGP